MMENKIKTLSNELSALSDEDLNQIAGSGDENFVNITDRQCETVKKYYERQDSPLDSRYRVLANYGGPCPRYIFEEAMFLNDSDSL